MPACSKLDHLARNIRKAWKKLAMDTAYLTKLTNFMPNKVKAVIDAGHRTKLTAIVLPAAQT